MPNFIDDFATQIQSDELASVLGFEDMDALMAEMAAAPQPYPNRYAFNCDQAVPL